MSAHLLLAGFIATALWVLNLIGSTTPATSGPSPPFATHPAPAPVTGAAVRSDWQAAAQRNGFNRMIGRLYYCLQQRKRFVEPLAFSAPLEVAESAVA